MEMVLLKQIDLETIAFNIMIFTYWFVGGGTCFKKKNHLNAFSIRFNFKIF